MLINHINPSRQFISSSIQNSPRILNLKILAKDIVAKIQNAFSDGTMWKSELQTIARMVSQLDPKENQNFVSLISQTPSKNKTNQSLLRQWLGEVTSDGIGAYGGLSEKARDVLWRHLVRQQNASHLDLIRLALTDSQQTRQPHVEALGRAIAAHAAPDVKIQWIQKVSKLGHLKNPSVARAVAYVMAEIKSPIQLEGLVGEIGRLGMDAVVAASFDRDRWEASLFVKLAHTMKLSSNPRIKSSFVAASGPVFDLMVNDHIFTNLKKKIALSQVSESLSNLIATDVNGIIENTLLQNGEFPIKAASGVNQRPIQGPSSGRRALKSLCLGLIDTKKTTYIGAMLIALQRSNDASKDPIQWLSMKSSRSGEPPSYHHARLMGEFLGITRSALTSRISARDLQSGRASIIFGAAADTVKETFGFFLPPSKLVAGLGATWAKGSVNYLLLDSRTALAGEDNDLGQALYNAAVPNHANGVEATGEWTATLAAYYAASKDRA